jgi:PPP family 3-phenylpropionic acid transporter
VSASFRLSLFYAAYFLAAGVQLPFWPVWLAGRGMDAAEIGALTALSQWVKVGSTPALGWLADRARGRPRFMVLLGALAAAGYLLCVPAHGFAAILLPSLLAAAAAAALLPLADATTLALASGGVDYGRVRLWGTIAFIAATVIGGRVLTGRSSELVLTLLIAMSVLIALACAVLPRGAHRVAAARAPWRMLLQRRHAVFVASALLIQSSHAVYYAFGTLYWQRVGLPDFTIALLWAEGAVAEVALFYAGARVLRRISPGMLMAVGGAGAFGRWTAPAFVTSVPALALLQPLHALSFAATHLGAMHWIARTAPPEAAATAQSLYNALVGGLGFGLASLAAGALYGAYGGKAYLAMAAMAGVGALLAVFLERRYLQRR